MEQELNFFKGICEEQTKKIQELEKQIQTLKGEYYKESEFDGNFKKMTKDELIGYCEVMSQRVKFHDDRAREFERIIKHNKSVDADKKLARERWRERIMKNEELFELLKQYKFLDEEGYFLHFTIDPDTC